MQFNEVIEEINKRIDIVELVSRYVPLTQRGKNFIGLCPFHDEKTPSFSVNPEKNIAYCFGCKKGGNPIVFYQNIEKITLKESVERLARELNLETSNVFGDVKTNLDSYYEVTSHALNFYYNTLVNTESGQNALKYLENRNIGADIINEFKIGYAPKDDLLLMSLKIREMSISLSLDVGLTNIVGDGSYHDFFTDRLIFPVRNFDGNVVAYSGRVITSQKEMKYINSPSTPIFDKSKVLYRLYEAKQEIINSKFLILTEGFFDCIAFYKAGFKNVVASMGTNLSKDHIRDIKKISDTVVISYDGDDAGINGTLSAMHSLLEENVVVKVITWIDKLDPDEYLNKYGIQAFNNFFNENLMDAFLYLNEKYLPKISKLDSGIEREKLTNLLKDFYEINDDYRNSDYYLTFKKTLNIYDSQDKFIKIDKNKLISKVIATEISLFFACLESKNYALIYKNNLSENEKIDDTIKILIDKCYDWYLMHEDENTQKVDENDFFDYLTESEKIKFEYLKTHASYSIKGTYNSEYVKELVLILKNCYMDVLSYQKLETIKTNDHRELIENSKLKKDNLKHIDMVLKRNKNVKND
ncbi:MAG: DNA primase [Acholeplasmatales bacterium]|jgi:DNA primase|nr:DNA primase [Acholeplasmatales bacterium]